MKDIALALGIILALTVGSLIGYALGTEQIRQEAVANSTAHWVVNTDRSTTFVWN